MRVPPKSSILIVFFFLTIDFGAPLFQETSIYLIIMYFSLPASPFHRKKDQVSYGLAIAPTVGI